MKRDEAIEKLVSTYRKQRNIIDNIYLDDDVDEPDEIPEHILNLALGKLRVEDEANLLYDALLKHHNAKKFTIGVREAANEIVVYPIDDAVSDEELQNFKEALGLKASISKDAPTKILPARWG